MNRKIINDKNATNNSYIFKFLPYWPLFLILSVIAIAGAWIYLKLAAPVYEINASILIKDETKGSEDAKALESLDLISPKRTIDNEIEVIQSKPLLNNVVKDLNLNAPIFEKKKFTTTSAYISSPIKILADSLSLKETPAIYFTVKNDNVIIDKTTYPLNRWVITPYGSLEFKKNNYATEPQNDKLFYFSLISNRKIIAGLASNLKVIASNKMSSILDISLNDEIPIRGENIINDLIKVYNQSIIDEKNVLASNTSAFLGKHLEKVESDLLGIEQKLQNYKSSRGAVDVDAQGKLYLQNVSNNDQQVSEINTKLSVLNQVESYVKSKDLVNGIVPSTVGIDDPGLSQMVKNVYDLQIEAESLKKTTGENNPLYLSYTDRIEKIKPQILENLQNQRASLQASKKNISSTNSGYSSVLQDMPSTQRQLVDISREQNIESGLYTFLLQKKEETELSYVSNLFGSKIIDPAEAIETPVSPKKKFVYLGSLIAALLFGVGIVGAKESLRSKVMFQKDIEDLTILPIIGEITEEKTKNPIVIYNDQRTIIAEQFRKLRTTLNFLGVGANQKRIMVTSTMSGEGKSFVALNLAISLALTGKKVVLLDYDLNNPSLARKLDIDAGHAGVTEYLQGVNNTESIILPTDINENLFFIPTGKLPNNPSELITNGKSEILLKSLDVLFDYIIIDIAPVGPVSDAYILSPFCDATLYIVRHGYTPKIFVERIDENNKLNKLTNAAIVFNSVSSRGVGSKYGYGYGYGYTYGDKKNKRKLLN